MSLENPYPWRSSKVTCVASTQMAICCSLKNTVLFVPLRTLLGMRRYRKRTDKKTVTIILLPMTIAEFVLRPYRGYLGQTTSTRTILMAIEKRGPTSLLRDPFQRLLTTSGEWCGSKTQRPLLWFVFINRTLPILWCKHSFDFSGPWLGVKFFSPFARK